MSRHSIPFDILSHLYNIFHDKKYPIVFPLRAVQFSRLNSKRRQSLKNCFQLFHRFFSFKLRIYIYIYIFLAPILSQMDKNFYQNLIVTPYPSINFIFIHPLLNFKSENSLWKFKVKTRIKILKVYIFSTRSKSIEWIIRDNSFATIYNIYIYIWYR